MAEKIDHSNPMNENDNAVELDQMKLFLDISRLVTAQAEKRGVKLLVLARQQNACIEAANIVVAAFRQGYMPAKPGCGVKAWLESDDVGASSRFMAHILFDAPKADMNYPHASDDFSRCVTLWRAATEAERAYMNQDRWCHLSARSPQWKALVPQWEELVALYDAGNWAQLGTRLKRIGEAK